MKPDGEAVAMFCKSGQAGISQIWISFPCSFSVFWVTAYQKLLGTHQGQARMVWSLASVMQNQESKIASRQLKNKWHVPVEWHKDVDGKNAWPDHCLCIKRCAEWVSETCWQNLWLWKENGSPYFNLRRKRIRLYYPVEEGSKEGRYRETIVGEKDNWV